MPSTMASFVAIRAGRDFGDVIAQAVGAGRGCERREVAADEIELIHRRHCPEHPRDTASSRPLMNFGSAPSKKAWARETYSSRMICDGRLISAISS